MAAPVPPDLLPTVEDPKHHENMRRLQQWIALLLAYISDLEARISALE